MRERERERERERLTGERERERLTGERDPIGELGISSHRMKAMLVAIGLTAASFRVPRLGMNCPGGYRKLIAYPKNLSWSFKTFPQTSSTGLEMNFDLEPSTYATMFMREITKNIY